MTDLTDSYCERCGARYIFSPPVPKTLSLKGAKVLAKGLKNFVLTDGQSMADSLTLARHDDQHQDSTRMTEAFHRTFNFCMTCRQYACDRCWNSKVGACLSCSPEEGYLPVAPEDHMIVRTPVAKWDADWSLFPDGPAVEPLVRPAAPAFDAPIVFLEPASTMPAVSAPASPESAWPISDLPDEAAAPATDGQRPARPYHKPVDQQAASLWPLADEIAPEMTLTPEEMELVESRLGQATTPDEPPVEAIAVAPVEAIAEATAEVPAEIVQRPQPPAPDLPSAAPIRFVPVPEPAAPTGWLSGSAQWAPLVEPEPEPEPEEAETLPILVKPVDDTPWALDLERPAAQARLLKMPAQRPLASQARPVPELEATVPPMATEAPRQPEPEPVNEPVREHTPIVGRLLGRHVVNTESATPAPPALATDDVQPTAEPWPHATPWSDRPVMVTNWWSDADVAADEVAAQSVAQSAALSPSHGAAPTPATADAPIAAVPVVTPEPARQPWPIAPQITPGPVDARSAAEVRLSAVSDYTAQRDRMASAEPAPADLPSQPALFDLPPAAPAVHRPTVPESPLWPAADHEVAEAVRARSSKQAERTQEPRQTAPQEAPAEVSGPFMRPAAPSAPWQPLGTSWPADQSPKAPWPGPELPSVLSVVAAQQTTAPTVTEMWAQSSQEVLSRGTVRVCHRCALPVSTQARFCRRCGTPQS